MGILYKGLRGSWLHQQNVAKSDKDYFVVFNEPGHNGKSWRKGGIGVDHNYRGIGVFFHYLSKCSTQTMEALYAKEYKAHPDFQKLILDRLTDIEDSELIFNSYLEDFKNQTRRGAAPKIISSAFVFQNFTMKYFQDGKFDPVIRPSDPRYDQYCLIRNQRHGNDDWTDAQRLEYAQKYHAEAIATMRSSGFVKKRNQKIFDEAADFFLTPEEKMLYVG